jgi:predicted GNAT family N-acyltransferase
VSIRLALGGWQQLAPDAMPLRHEVFVVEQRVPEELELDEFDPLSLHAVARDELGSPVGTGRLLPDGHIGRMAVLRSHRGLGIGTAILTALMQEAEKRGDRCVRLHAQVHAEAFYARHGFVREGTEFIEAGIPHVAMRHDLG